MNLTDKKKFIKVCEEEIEKGRYDRLPDCWICFCKIDHDNEEQEFILNCEHKYHRECVQGWVDSSLNSKSVQIKCPQKDCPLHIQDFEIKEFVSKPDYEKLLKFRIDEFIMNNQKDIIICSTPNCESFIFFTNP